MHVSQRLWQQLNQQDLKEFQTKGQHKTSRARSVNEIRYTAFQSQISAARAKVDLSC